MPSPNGHAQHGPPELTTLQPEPMPLASNVIQVQTEQGEMLVMLRVSTPAGVAYYFLPAGAAVDLGKALTRTGEASRAGLTLPGGGLR